MRPNLNPSATPSGKQLELEISTEEARPGLAAIHDPIDSQNQHHRNWITPWTFSLALIMGTLVMLILVISTADDSSAGVAKKPEQFRLIDMEISVPERRRFPPIDLPSEGLVIQVGIFTKLGGAERKQIALTHLGLEPYVQKRVTENGLQYAVLLDPISSTTHDRALATLTENNYSYFHRPKRGS